MMHKSFPVKGMHCRSCELLIEGELLKVPGIKRAVVNHSSGTADVYYRHGLDSVAVEHAVTTAGYSLGSDQKFYISKNLSDYKELGIAFLIVMVLYLVAKNLGLFNLASSIKGNYSSLPVVFIIGLTAGVSTCMALVGGLVLGASAKFTQTHPQASRAEKFSPHLFFNTGRIVSYFILGGVIGLVGSFFQLSALVLGLLTIAVAAVMLLLGGQLIEIFPFLKKFSFTLPKFISRSLGVSDLSGSDYSHKNAMVMGALTFFLPCGFTQAMQLYAMSTGSPISGAVTMGVFALGTAPGLLGVGGLSSIVKGSSARIFFKTAGVVVILMAFFNISNGINLLGLNLAPAVKGVSADSSVPLVNGVREIAMRQIGSGYVPNQFTIKKGVPVKWIINSQDSNTCAASLISPQLGIRQILQPGENIFTFTPAETGTIRFSCSMGMYRGTFNVI